MPPTKLRRAREVRDQRSGWNPIRFFAGWVGAINCLIAAKTAANFSSYFFSKFSILRARLALLSINRRSCTNVRIMAMLTRSLPIARSHHHATNAVYPTASPHVVFICTACGLLEGRNRVASIFLTIEDATKLDPDALAQRHAARLRVIGYSSPVIVNVYGRHYILRSEIARFNARAAGEFAKPPIRPGVSSRLAKRTL